MIFGWTAILKDTQQFLLPAIVTCRSGALLKFDVQRNCPNGETTSGYGTIFLGFHPFEQKNHEKFRPCQQKPWETIRETEPKPFWDPNTALSR